MTDLEIKNLRHQIKLANSKKRPFLAESEKERKKFENKISIYLNTSFVILVFSLLFFYLPVGRNTSILGILVAISIFLMSISLRIKSKIKPKNVKIDEWHWSMRNKLNLLYISNIPIVFSFVFFLDKSSKLFDFSFIASIICAIIFFTLTFLIKIRPILFLNQILTTSASFAAICGIIFFLFSIPLIVSSYLTETHSEKSLLAYFFLVMLFSVFISYKNLNYRNNFNLCQDYALKLIRPTKITSFLKTQSEKYNEEIIGIEFLKKLNQQNSELIDKIILEKLNKKYKNRFQKLWVFVLGIITSTIVTVYQAISQDLILTNEVKSFLCNSIGALCN